MGAHNRLRRLLRRNSPPPPPGSVVLRQFISTLSTPLSRTLHASSIVSQADFEYVLKQGAPEREVDQIRQQVNARVIRGSAKILAGSWCRLVLGDEYAGKSRKQSHVLRFVMQFCVCLKCRVEAARGDLGMEDMDQMLQDAQLGEEGVEGRVMGCGGVGFVELPRELEFLGEVLESQELELGVVKNIGNRGRVVLNSFAKMLVSGWEYLGRANVGDMIEGVLKRAREYYKQHGGKTERRVYVRGKAYRFGLEGICGVVYPAGKNGVGVVFRKQTMTVFVGQLALEDSFGAFIDVDVPLYVGFGEDSNGAQTVYEDGSMGETRSLGVNELLSHVQFGGDSVQFALR